MEEASENIIVNIRVEDSEDARDARDGGSAADSASGEVDSEQTRLTEDTRAPLCRGLACYVKPELMSEKESQRESESYCD
jgi:hypothetical protein